MCDFELPRDEDGEVIPHDHPELVDGAHIIRRISDDYVVPDHNSGGHRLSSAVYKHDPRRGHLSVDSTPCIVAKGIDPGEYVTTPQWPGALTISIENFRSIDSVNEADDRWKIGMVPVTGNDCHAGVWGKITQGQSNSLQRLSDWLVEIPGVTKLMPD
ncbi:hypothetical protein HFP57_11995 [Parasphingopyxis algicola]|uniref:hypothetical protein n=1 Tax=Parasphingopyxis algicola TaxID=2026624 RepID=UPI0015A44553|nr:hypothetical protein [Parasphingopyxis algicola]QLC25666.1 hypothetical protein HFP57_11995 [Parasphingopyxis algicola]